MNSDQIEKNQQQRGGGKRRRAFLLEGYLDLGDEWNRKKGKNGRGKELAKQGGGGGENNERLSVRL